MVAAHLSRPKLAHLLVMFSGYAGAAGCEHVLQTARLGDTSTQLGGSSGAALGGAAPIPQASALDCSSTPATTSLPAQTASEPAVIEEGDARWPVAAQLYDAQEGPGLFVSARDTFRLYVNGHLLAQSNDARELQFVPLTFVPGKNVISLSVHAEEGPPAALVQWDELDRSLLSDASWRSSDNPENGWHEPDFDDSAWDFASELGKVSPGCSPAGFQSDSAAEWIGPALEHTRTIYLRKSFELNPIGFGEHTRGGVAGSMIRVATWDELAAAVADDVPRVVVLAEGVHDFRRQGADVTYIDTCPIDCSDDPGKIIYEVPTGTATCASALLSKPTTAQILVLGSNKTILGGGRGAALRGVSFDFRESSNIILRNLAVFDVNRDLQEAGDAFTLTAPQNVWLDHVTVKWVSDGFADILSGTSGVTFSFVHFDGANEAVCRGYEPWTSTITNAEATIHHSRLDHTNARSPFAYGPDARVHLFNNVFSNGLDWMVGASCGAQVLLEGSTFESVAAATFIGTCADPTPLGLINAPASSNLYRDNSNNHLGGSMSEPHDSGVFQPNYEYELDTATNSWPLTLSRAGAGGLWAPTLSVD